MDKILQTEVLLNMLNTCLGKAIFLKDYIMIHKLQKIQYDIYHSDYNYNLMLQDLKYK